MLDLFKRKKKKKKSGNFCGAASHYKGGHTAFYKINKTVLKMY